jgi:hypothetical protein
MHLVAERGIAFSQKLLRPSGTDPFSYRISAGTLPPGLTLDRATAVLSGTPAATGSYWFAEEVRDADGSVVMTRHATLDVVGSPACARTTGDGDVDSFVRLETCRPYYATPRSYFPADYSVVAGKLPPGLELWGDGAAAAQLDGVPTRRGVYRFTIEATDALGGRARGTYTVRIYPKLVLPGRRLPSTKLGADYSAQISARGGKPPYTYGETSLGGLELDRTTGLLAGVVSRYVVCPFALNITDATGARATGF